MAKQKARRLGRPVVCGARHRQIASKLRARISTGDWQSGKILPSLQALARQYRVGIFTIRLALKSLKDEGRIGITAGRRIIATPKSGPWNVTHSVILLVLTDCLNEALATSLDTTNLLRGIQMGAGETRMPLMIIHHPILRSTFPPGISDFSIGGILLLGLFPPALLERYGNLNVPVVLVDRPGKQWNMHSISVENEASAATAVAWLIAQGHRRIAFLRYVQTSLRDVDPDSKERQNGFFAALKAAGIPRDSSAVFNSFPSDTPDSPAIRRIVDPNSGFSAVLAASAGRAKLLARAADIAGRSVPDSFCIVCFQGREARYPEFPGPRIDFEEMGLRAVHLLKKPRRQPCHVHMSAPWADALR